MNDLNRAGLMLTLLTRVMLKMLQVAKQMLKIVSGFSNFMPVAYFQESFAQTIKFCLFECGKEICL